MAAGGVINPNLLMIRSDKHKLTNRLWQARKRARLGQKQVARLLRHATPDQVSRFERGERLPTLEVALRLEIVLGVPLRHLYAGLHKSLKRDIEQEVRSNPGLARAFMENNSSDFGEFCSHASLLQKPELTAEEREAARRHVTEIARKLANL